MVSEVNSDENPHSSMAFLIVDRDRLYEAAEAAVSECFESGVGCFEHEPSEFDARQIAGSIWERLFEKKFEAVTITNGEMGFELGKNGIRFRSVTRPAR